MNYATRFGNTGLGLGFGLVIGVAYIIKRCVECNACYIHKAVYVILAFKQV